LERSPDEAWSQPAPGEGPDSCSALNFAGNKKRLKPLKMVILGSTDGVLPMTMVILRYFRKQKMGMLAV